MLASAFITCFVALSAGIVAQAAPADFQKANALDAQKLNAQFALVQSSDPCSTSSPACVGHDFARCINGKWDIAPCSAGTICIALPLVNKPGTAVTCGTESDAIVRMQNAGVEASLTGAGLDEDTTPSPTPSSADDSDPQGHGSQENMEAREYPAENSIVHVLPYRREVPSSDFPVPTPSLSSTISPSATASSIPLASSNTALASQAPSSSSAAAVTSSVSGAQSASSTPRVIVTVIETHFVTVSAPDATSTSSSPITTAQSASSTGSLASSTSFGNPFFPSVFPPLKTSSSVSPAPSQSSSMPPASTTSSSVVQASSASQASSVAQSSSVFSAPSRSASSTPSSSSPAVSASIINTSSSRVASSSSRASSSSPSIIIVTHLNKPKPTVGVAQSTASSASTASSHSVSPSPSLIVLRPPSATASQ